MLDPRIYRMGLVPVVLAVIVLAFSLDDQPGALTTNLAPDAFNGAGAYSTMRMVASQYPQRRPGSIGDDGLASYTAGRLRRDGYSVSTDVFNAGTVDGRRTLENVVGVRAGAGSGSIVVVAGRDALSAPATAAASSTAVLLELARVLAGQNLDHTVVLASISGSEGGAGARELARSLSRPVDAVLVLGDMAGSSVSPPLIVPWSAGQRLAPPALRNTLATAFSAESALNVGSYALGGQFVRLALPMASSDQAPFDAAGEPAVLASLAGERGPGGDAAVSRPRITASGRAVLRAVTALDAGPAIPPPTSYLVWEGKIIPTWAVRLVVLMLMLPVLGAVVDGLARARRRRQAAGGAMAWVLTASVPFMLAALLDYMAVRLKLIAPGLAELAGPGGVALHAGAITAMALGGLVIVAGLLWLWPLIGGRVTGAGAARRDPAAGPALLMVLCLVALAMWVTNPFAAALLLPALHLWLWALEPEVRLPGPVAGGLVALGLAPPVLAGVYYMTALGLDPVGAIWRWMLGLGGGAVSPLWALEWSLVGGCLAAAIVLALSRALRRRPQDATVTIRGPVTYAGPGSLGGTESALRR